MSVLAHEERPSVTVRGLRKVYGDIEAVAGINLTIMRGEVFTLLGPNGAGQTTTVEILEGYRRRSAGEVAVLGLDPETGGRALRERIGIVLVVWGAAGAIVAVRRFAAEEVDEAGSSSPARLLGRSPRGALR